MRYNLIIILALAIFIIGCAPVCPPGATLGPDGVCCEGQNGVCSEDTSDQVSDVLSEQLVEPTEPTETEPMTETVEETPAEEGTEDADTVEAEESTDDTELAIGPEPEEEAPPIQGDLADFVNTYNSKVKSYEFSNGARKFKYKNGKLRIELEHPEYKRNVQIGNETYSLFYYDVIYVDLGTKQAEGYCEGYDTDLRKQCIQEDIEDVPLALEYGEYTIQMPHEWIQEWAKNATATRIEPNKYNIQKRAVTLVQMPGYEAYIDPMLGLPLKITKSDGFTEYSDLVSNTVKDYEMHHRTYLEVLQQPR